MKTVIKSAALFGAVSLLAACGGEEITDASVDQNYHDITTTLQGSVFNALDNTRITDEELTITLVQGDKYREAKVLTGDDDFAGDYSLQKIPTSTGGNISYRMIATATGYQPFEAIVGFNVASLGNNNLQDEAANRVGNIYMYPLGTNASDVTVSVTFNNEPVANATVLLNPNTGANVITTDSVNIIPRSNGLQEAQTAVTDASGIATFAAASLVLGGTYHIDVMPTVFEGSQIQLQVNRGAAFTVGAATTTRNVTMLEAVPGNDNGLYVTSASNLLDAVNSEGTLTLTFSQAVSFVNEDNITATLTNDTTAVLDTTDNVTGELSADGKTLTLTPKFSTAPVVWTGSNDGTADNGLEVEFANVEVRIVGAANSSTVYDVFALTAETGGNPSDTVQVTETF